MKVRKKGKNGLNFLERKREGGGGERMRVRFTICPRARFIEIGNRQLHSQSLNEYPRVEYIMLPIIVDFHLFFLVVVRWWH